MNLLAHVLLRGILMTAPNSGAPMDLVTMARLPAEERRALTKSVPADALAKIFAEASTESLLEAGRIVAAQMGTYEARLVKTERISGEMTRPQMLRLVVRETPLAVRMDVIEGPAKGRKVAYDSTVRKDEIRAKESGLLGIAGAVWISKDSSLARRDTNHPVTDLAFGSVLRILETCFSQAKPLGGYSRKDEGFDRSGRYCMTFTAPPKGTQLYATRARICVDPLLALPVDLDIDDAKGKLEHLEFSDIKPVSGISFAPSSL